MISIRDYKDFKVLERNEKQQFVVTFRVPTHIHRTDVRYARAASCSVI